MTVKVWQIPILLVGFVALLYVIGQSAYRGGGSGSTPKLQARGQDQLPVTTSAAVTTRAAAPPQNGNIDPKSRLQAMLNKLSGTDTGDAFLVDDCSSNNDFNGQNGYDCHVINGIAKSYDTWHIEIASDGSGASAWNNAHPDSSTLCDPAC